MAMTGTTTIPAQVKPQYPRPKPQPKKSAKPGKGK